MKQSDEELRSQINELIRDEIQENINDYVDEKEGSPIGFANEEDELKVNIENDLRTAHDWFESNPFLN